MSEEAAIPTIIIGTSKPVLNYVTALITVFNRGAERVSVRARGQAINVAVEVIQLLRTKFMNDVFIAEAGVDGDKVVTEDGRVLYLPVLEMVLHRNLG